MFTFGSMPWQEKEPPLALGIGNTHCTSLQTHLLDKSQHDHMNLLLLAAAHIRRSCFDCNFISCNACTVLLR